MLEKVPQCKINGERIDCRYATCQNLAFFEEEANKRKGKTTLTTPWYLVCITKCQDNIFHGDVFCFFSGVPLRTNKETKESDSSDEILSVLLAQKTAPSAIPPLFPSHPLANSFPPLPGPSFGHPPPLFPHMPQTIAPLMAAPLFPPHPVPVPSHPSLGMHPTYFSPAQDGHSSKAYSQQTWEHII